MENITFDQAAEILEITNVEELTLEFLNKRIIRAKKRWHPDTIAHLNDKDLLDTYTKNFKLIDPAAKLILAYLKGEYGVKDKFQNVHYAQTKEPFEIIRENAREMQIKLNRLWEMIKEKKYKHTVEEIVLSNGFVLKELLSRDFKKDIAMLAVISFVTYNSTLGLLTLVLGMFYPVIGLIGGGFWLSHAFFNFLAFLPLSRFWLPEKLQYLMFWFVGIGLKIHNWLSFVFQFNLGAMLVLQFIILMGKFFKYIILFPLYEVAKLMVGNRVVGVIKQKTNYYANVAEWYIKYLIQKSPAEMDEQELYDLSYLYTELIDVEKE